MGDRGPVPKRSDQRHGHRSKAENETDTPPAGDFVVAVEAPEPDDSWHAIAKAWYLSLGESGQSIYYEPSDWATAYLLAESMSRDLGVQVVGIVAQGPKAGEVVMGTIPLKGASLAAYLKAMSSLLVTEGDRRRASVELQRGNGEPDPQAEHEATVTNLRSIAGNG